MKLDEKGVVFLDGAGRPYLCRMWEGEPWLFYWHPEGHWTTLRKVSQAEVFSLPNNLSPADQEVYHDQHKKWELRLSRIEDQGEANVLQKTR